MTYYILYGTKDNLNYYIANTNPIIYSGNLSDSKIYYSRYTAEFDVLRDYDNYRAINKLIESKALDCLFVARIENDEEVGRVKIL